MIDEIIVNNIKINQLRPTKKDFVNKNNKFSAQGFCKDMKVKVYEVLDEKQGLLREFISNNNDLSKYFPKLITFDKKFIIEEWVNGKTLKQLNFKNLENIPETKEIKNILDQMWSVKYNYQVFDYINYIHKRVNKNNQFDLSKVPNRINHNDLSLDNIIITPEGLKIIDNEFLGCNNGWILNVKNSFLEENFEYQKFVSEDTLNKLWNVRKEWSKIIKINQFKKKWNLVNFFKNILK